MRIRDELGAAALVGFGSYLGNELGVAWRFPEIGSAVLFPPYAVLAAALLLSPPRRWGVLLCASFAGHFLSVWPEFPASWAAAAEAANAARALIVAVVLRRLGWRGLGFDTFEGVAAYLLVAVGLAPAGAALIGAAVVVLHHGWGDNWSAWWAWFSSNAVTGLTVLPLILIGAARPRPWRFRVRWRRLVEATLLAAGLLVVGVLPLVDVHIAPGLPSLPYAPLPFLLWAAARFGPGGASASILIVTTGAVWGAVNGRGPFTQAPADANLLSLYSFIGFAAVPCMLLAALVKERERVLGALRESQRRYRLATDAGPVIVWDWTRGASEIYVDPRLRSALGFAPDELGDGVAAWVGRLHPEDAERVIARVRAVVDGSAAAFEVEHRMVHKDGSPRWFVTRGAAVRDGDARRPRLTGTATDVSARMRAESEVHEQRRELAHLSRVALVGELSGALAHELNQPLTAILTNTDAARRLLAMTPVDRTEMRAILDDIAHDTTRAADVIRRIRALLRKEEGELELLSVDEVAIDVLRIARGDLVARGASVRTILAPALPRVRGDRVQLQQVVLNLIVNACDAMVGVPLRDRRLTIGARFEGGDVILSVADQGPGIPPARLEEVFEPFVTSKPNGLGLGLAICRSIALAHDGRLWAASNGDGGTTFHLALRPAER